MTSIEGRVQKIGRELLELAGSYQPAEKSKLLDFLLKTIGKNRELMRQLLRLTDVLSALHGQGNNKKEITEHLRQYLGEVHPFYRVLLQATHLPGLEGLTASLTQDMVLKMARRFIAGKNFQEAIPVLDRLEKGADPLTVTFDLLGEAVVSEEEAHRYEENYLTLIREMGRRYPGRPVTAGGIPLGHVSLKLSSLSAQFNPADPQGTLAIVVPRLVRLFTEAKKQGIMLNVDIEQSIKVDLAYQIFKESLMAPALRDFSDAAVVIQGYLCRSAAIYEDLLDWVKRPVKAGGRGGVPIQVRLVKGAYWDFENAIAAQRHWKVPVYKNKSETDINFEAMTHRMLEGNNWTYCKPAFGTHNARSIAVALAEAEVLQVPSTAMEFQMLYGMEEDLRYAAAHRGCAVRVYTPVGNMIEGIAYLVRRILENASQQGFVQMKRGQGDARQLLATPQVSASHVTTSQVTTSQVTRGVPLEDFRFHNAPVTDFSLPEAQENMRLTQEFVQSKFGRSYPMWIKGEAVESKNWHTVTNPYRKTLRLGSVPFATMDQVDQAVSVAYSQIKEWRTVPSELRAKSLFKAAELMTKKRTELAAWMVYEVGKNWAEADADVVEAIDFLNYYGHEMRRISKFSHDYEARGVVAVLPPWNFPLAITTGMTAAALVTGNTVVLKPSERAPLMGAHLAEILNDPQVGLPRGVFNIIYGDRDVGQRLVQAGDVAMVAFTGSKSAGLDILKKSGEAPYRTDRGTIKKVIAEMGGKNAIIIDRDAHPDEAVLAVVQSAFSFQGQKCSACSRVLVHEEVYEKLVTRLRQAVASIPVGSPDNPGTVLSSVVDGRSVRSIEEALETHRGHQDRIASQKGGDNFVKATLVRNVPAQHPLAQQELFGPVLTVLRYSHFNEAIDMVNSVEYALTAGLISRNLKHIEQFKETVEAGNIYINRTITGAIVERQPFGGFKMSGTGPKAGGDDYLFHFMKTRWAAQRYETSEGVEGSGMKIVPTPSPAQRRRALTVLKYKQRKWAQVSVQKRVLKLEAALKAAGPLKTDSLEPTWKQAKVLAQSRSTQTVPGELNELTHRPRGMGLLVIGPEATEDDQLKTLLSALSVGNALLVTGEGFKAPFEKVLKELSLRAPLIYWTASQPLEQLACYPFDFSAFIGLAEDGIKLYGALTQNMLGKIPGFIGVPFDTNPQAHDFTSRFVCPVMVSENTLQEGVDMRADFS